MPDEELLPKREIYRGTQTERERERERERQRDGMSVAGTGERIGLLRSIAHNATCSSIQNDIGTIKAIEYASESGYSHLVEQ